MNEADVAVHGEDNHVAICQVLILVDAIIVLSVEDHLGLVTLPARTPLTDVFAQQLEAAPAASCDIDIGAVRLHLPSSVSTASFVSGPEVVGLDEPILPAGRLAADVEPGNGVSICQEVILLGAFVVGGSAFGLTSTPSGVLTQSRSLDTAQPGSNCRVRVSDVGVEFA